MKYTTLLLWIANGINVSVSFSFQGKFSCNWMIKPTFFSEIQAPWKSSPQYRMEDWAGSPEIKEEVLDIVQFISQKELFSQTGTKIPKGILLEGPPGTGKTLLAKIIASESNSHFISISASEFIELYVGMGASRVRKLFKDAREKKPTIIFIDEIDAIGKHRGQSLSGGGGNDERDQTLNQLLVEMDGFQENEDVFLIAATNRIDMLDHALLRPGRFDRIIRVPLPDFDSRIDILKRYLHDKVWEHESISLEELSSYMDGFSGAQIFNIINEASILMIKDKNQTLTEDYLMKSLEKMWVGIPKTKEDRPLFIQERIAIHEVGHAFLAFYFSNIFELQKVTIQNMYHGGVGGFTLYRDHSDYRKYGLYTKDMLDKKIIVLLGGRIAEDIHYGLNHTSIGSMHDLKTANELAIQMFLQYGLNDAFPFFYYDHSSPLPLSDMMTYLMEEQVLLLLKSAYDSGKSILLQHDTEVKRLVSLLLEKKTLHVTDFDSDSSL